MIGVVLAILILASVVMAGFMLINGSLSRRSVCYAIMVMCISVYTIIGYIWTAGNDETVLSRAYLIISTIVFVVFIYSVYLAFLSLMPLKNKTFMLAVVAGAVPIIIYLAVNVGKPELWEITSENGLRSMTPSDMWLIIHQYIYVLSYVGIAVYCSVKNMQLTKGVMRKRAKMAMLGLTIGFTIAMSFEVLLGATGYGHSLMHMVMFVLIFCSYKTFMDEPIVANS